MEIKHDSILSKECQEQIRAIKDTMELISGKWKLIILGTLLLNGTMRFMELKRTLTGIAPKKLSKDLQELEMNLLVKREVKNTKPITVEYSITDHGRTMDTLLAETIDWGLKHRKEIIQ
jgi:DNA-binding HxlR family transcriptional regulator